MRSVLPPGGDACARNTDCPHGVAEMTASIGAVGKHLAGIVGKRFRTGLAIVDVRRRDGDLLEQSRIGVGIRMRLEAMNSGTRPLCLTQGPSSSSSFAGAMIVGSR